MRNPCIDVVVGELNRVRARHHVEPAAEGAVRIHWTAPHRPPQVTVVPAASSDPLAPQRARAGVRAQLKRLGILTDGTGHGIRGWSSSDPPLSPSPPLSPLQAAIDEIASRVAQLSLFGRDPTRFASERSEIVNALRRIARG